jgi:hypothetical protein
VRLAQIPCYGLVVVLSLCQGIWAATPTTSPHGPKFQVCEKCHTLSSWKPPRSDAEFDHGHTEFPLRGLHVKVPCGDCHVNPILANTGKQCQDCHVDIHRHKNGSPCDICHRVYGWQVSVHSINEHQDRFPLIGAHAVADCYSCHRAGAVGEFNRQGLSTECVSCHLKAFQQTTTPNHRALGYSMSCQDCHFSMDSWRIPGSSMPRRRR